MAQQSADIEAPLEADLFKTGVVARILQVLKLPGDTLKILVEAKYRATYDQCNQGAYLTATVHPVKDLESDVDLLKRYRTLLTHRFNEYTELNQTACCPQTQESLPYACVFHLNVSVAQDLQSQNQSSSSLRSSSGR